MRPIIIYGAGNIGRSAYFYLKGAYECLFFVDGDNNKWGKEIEGIEIKAPEVLKQIKDIKVLIASTHWKEILEEIREYELTDVTVYKPELEVALSNEVWNELNVRTIDLGDFLKKQNEIECKELTFMPGGSGILDYAFLKTIAKKYNCKKYLEIGTYIGESINILTDYCDKLYSITAPLDAPYSMKYWCKQHNLPLYSERLTYSEKIKHFFTDSKLFDFSQISDEIDLFFIDGDHSYKGVYADTKNVFKIKKDNAIVVWHDFRKTRFTYNEDVVCAVKDALGDDFKNVYVTDRNLCGVYLPNAYIKDFKMTELKYSEDMGLYTYDVVLKNFQIK